MKRKPKTVALGAPLNTSDEDLDLLALVSMEDIEDAKATAAARMGERGRALMEAERAEGEAAPDDTLPLGT